MNKIELNNLELKIFAEQDVLDYCQLNNINPEDIIYLELSSNKLTDISGIKLFKNLEKLYINNNKLENIFVIKNLIKLKVLYLNSNPLKDISAIKNLNNLEILRIDNLELGLDQIKYINCIKNLKELFCHKGFNFFVLNRFNKNLRIYK